MAPTPFPPWPYDSMELCRVSQQVICSFTSTPFYCSHLCFHPLGALYILLLPIFVACQYVLYHMAQSSKCHLFGAFELLRS